MSTNVIELDQHRPARDSISTPPLPAGEGALPDASVLIGLAVRHSLMFGGSNPVPDEILLPLMAQATRGCSASEAVLAWLYRRQVAAVLGGTARRTCNVGPLDIPK